MEDNIMSLLLFTDLLDVNWKMKRRRKKYVKVIISSVSHFVALGITLLTIPYTWDGTIGSLASFIHKKRPDVLPFSSASTISLDTQPEYQTQNPFLRYRGNQPASMDASMDIMYYW